MSLPIAIIDARSPQQAFETLAHDFTVVPFLSKNQTYAAIQGHPDVFITQGERLIVAPNCPAEILPKLPQNSFTFGEKPVGYELYNSTQYNCLITNNIILHKSNFTDPNIIRDNSKKTFIHVPQAYTRCNAFAITQTHFITSDFATHNTLITNKLESIFIQPQGILLPPYKYGFIGGCLGRFANTIYVNGSLATHSQGAEIRNFIERQNLHIVELHNGNLYDGGGLFFVQK